jgi:hypothetical protein
MVARVRTRSHSRRRHSIRGMGRRSRSRSHRRGRYGRGLGLAGGDWKRSARNVFRSIGNVLKRGVTSAVPALVSGLASGQDPRSALMSAGLAGVKGAVGMGRRRRRRSHVLRRLM